MMTDQECIQAVQAGRKDFDAILTAQPTIQDAIKSGVGITMVGDPVYYEDLALAVGETVRLPVNTAAWASAPAEVAWR